MLQKLGNILKCIRKSKAIDCKHTNGGDYPEKVSTDQLIPIGCFEENNRTGTGIFWVVLSLVVTFSIAILAIPLNSIVETVVQIIRDWLGAYGQHFLRVPDENPLAFGTLLTVMPLMAGAYLYLIRDETGELIARKNKSILSDWVLNIAIIIMLLGLFTQLAIAASSEQNGSTTTDELVRYLADNESHDSHGADDPSKWSIILSWSFVWRAVPAVFNGETLVYTLCVGVMFGLFGLFQNMRNRAGWEKQVGLRRTAKREAQATSEINGKFREQASMITLRAALKLRGSKLYKPNNKDEYIGKFSSRIAWMTILKDLGRSLCLCMLVNILPWGALVLIDTLTDGFNGYVLGFGFVSSYIGVLAAVVMAALRYKMSELSSWLLLVGVVMNQALLVLAAWANEESWIRSSAFTILIFSSYIMLAFSGRWRRKHQEKPDVDGRNPRISLRRIAVDSKEMTEEKAGKFTIDVPKILSLDSTLVSRGSKERAFVPFYFVEFSEGFPSLAKEPIYASLEESIAMCMFYAKMRNLGRNDSIYSATSA